MSQKDCCCSLAPYFKVHRGKLTAFKKGCKAFIEKTRKEPGCMYYGFSFDGDVAHCREGYTDADALLAHLENVDALLQKALKIADLVRLEVHAPKSEMGQLKKAMAGMKPQFFTLDGGFRI